MRNTVAAAAAGLLTCLAVMPAGAQTPSPRPAGQPPASIAELMRHSFELGFLAGQQFQGRVSDLTREMDDLRQKCGDRCAAPPAPEPAK
jgi:hypothetical protein